MAKKTQFELAMAQAAKRGISFSLTPSEYYEHRKALCYYCNSELRPVGVGLDRIDSDKGYHPENVVPCCGSCNFMKSTLPQDRFLHQIYKIYQNITLEVVLANHKYLKAKTIDDNAPANGALDGWGSHPKNICFDPKKVRKIKPRK